MATKYCLIENCFNHANDSKITQKKIFIRVPQNEDDRKRWFKAIFGHEDYTTTVNLFVCEDHFDLRKDAENFEEFKLVGTRLRLKKGVVPHIRIHKAIKEELPSHISSLSKKVKTANIRSLHSKKKFVLVNVEKIISIQTNEFPSGDLHVEGTKHRVHLAGMKKLEPFVQQEMTSRHQFGENSHVSEYQEAFMDTQLHPVSADAKDENTTTTITNQNFEEVYIKEEPVEEIFQDCEIYEKVLQSVKKEEDMTDDNDIGETDGINSNCFYCEVCNQNFARKVELRKHKEMHNREKEFTCYICNKYFSEKQALQIHLKIHERIKKFECSICKKILSRKDSLKLHMRIHDGVKEFQCPTCHKSFTQNYHLKSHLLSHSGIRNYKCKICEKSFTRSDTLSSHMAVHTGSKKHQCSICLKQFSLKNILNRHIKIHSTIRDKKCNICSKVFKDNSTLSKHIKIHSETKEHHCSICEKSFRRRSALKRHMNIHSRENN